MTPHDKALEEFLLGLMGEWDFTIPTGAFDLICDRLSALSRGEPVAWLVDAEFVDAGKIRTVSISKPFASSWPSGSTFTPLYLHPNAARGVDEWLPIESAPKEVDVMVYCPGAAIPRRIAMLCPKDDEQFVWLDTGCNKPGMFPPTHWRPLPVPPALEATNV